MSFYLLILFLITKILCDINIHIIPHTHLDPGWIRTPEEYYEENAIKNIFDGVLDQLLNTTNTQKTFVINELFFFKIWYENLSEDRKNKFKDLLKEKRIEFVSGGFVTNDEATPVYYDIVDQIRIGHQYLLEEFGITPKTGWYIDSFGHSIGNAYILSELNFENLVIGRMHDNFLELLKKEKKDEFYWELFGNPKKKIFTHVLRIHYGFQLFLPELGYQHEEFVSSINQILQNLIDKFIEIESGIKHKNIMFLYGDDFKYEDNNIFLNIDYLINNIFKNSSCGMLKDIKERTKDNINIFYSTPEIYFNAVKKELQEKNIEIDTYSNIDFYPLRHECIWTGFFTSRPYLKGYIRKASNIFYSFSKYFSLNKFLLEYIPDNYTSNLNYLREVVGLNQHHDAITGTSMQYVSTNYIERLKKGIKNVENNFKENFEEKYKVKIGKICYNNYIVDDNECSIDFFIQNNNINNEEIIIGLFNPLFDSDNNNNILINIEILFSEYEYEIVGINYDFICINENTIQDIKLFKYKNQCFLNFFYDFKKGEEFVQLTLKKTSEKIKYDKYIKFNYDNDNKIELIKNDINIQSLTFKPKNFEFNLEYYNEDQIINAINFTYYDGMYYTNDDTCKDGAYIFSPYNKYPDEIKIDYDNSFYYKGNLGIIFLTRNIETSFTLFTIFYNPFFIKVEHIFDNLDNSYFLKRFSFGYSFVLKTNINNLDKDQKPIFYTDSNGLEMMKRTIDKFPYEETEKISTGTNFYPVTTSISIKDENNKNKVSIFTDRAEAGTGYLPGSIILILQRMSFTSDNKGLPENLFEEESMKTDNFKTSHLIVFGISMDKRKDMKKDKFNSLNFVNSYMNTGLFYFKINKDKILKDEFKKNNELRNKMIVKCLKISPDIRANYEIINRNLIIGIYFRFHNYFFNSENINNDNADNSFGSISMKFDYDTKFKIYYDKTGINYNIKKGYVLNDEIKSKLITPKDQTLSLKINEFLYIYFYFENE